MMPFYRRVAAARRRASSRAFAAFFLGIFCAVFLASSSPSLPDQLGLGRDGRRHRHAQQRRDDRDPPLAHDAVESFRRRVQLVGPLVLRERPGRVHAVDLRGRVVEALERDLQAVDQLADERPAQRARDLRQVHRRLQPLAEEEEAFPGRDRVVVVVDDHRAVEAVGARARDDPFVRVPDAAEQPVGLAVAPALGHARRRGAVEADDPAEIAHAREVVAAARDQEGPHPHRVELHAAGPRRAGAAASCSRPRWRRSRRRPRSRTTGRARGSAPPAGWTPGSGTTSRRAPRCRRRRFRIRRAGRRRSRGGWPWRAPSAVRHCPQLRGGLPSHRWLRRSPSRAA